MGNFSWLSSSATSSLWLRLFRVFITRTIAASICAHMGTGLVSTPRSLCQRPGVA